MSEKERGRDRKRAEEIGRKWKIEEVRGGGREEERERERKREEERGR